MASASKYTLSTPQNILQDDSPLQDQWSAVDVATWDSENFVISLHNKPNFSTNRKFYSPVGKNRYMTVATTVSALEESGIVAVIGSKVVIAHGLQVDIYTIDQNDLIKTHHLRNSPKCIFANESEIFVSSFDCSKLIVFSSEFVTQREVGLEGIENRNYPVDLAVTSRHIYICTAESGKAKSFDKATGKRCCTFEYPNEGITSASSVTVVETVSLVLVLYQTGHILLFLAHPATCLFIIHSAMTDKIRALRENQLLAVEKSRVALYEMAGCFEFAKLIRTLAELLTDTQRDKLCEFYDISILAPKRPLAFLAYLSATGKVTPSDVSQLITAFTELGMVEHLCTVLKYKLQKIDIETRGSLKEKMTKTQSALHREKEETRRLYLENTELKERLSAERRRSWANDPSLAKTQSDLHRQIEETRRLKFQYTEIKNQLSAERPRSWANDQSLAKAQPTTSDQTEETKKQDTKVVQLTKKLLKEQHKNLQFHQSLAQAEKDLIEQKNETEKFKTQNTHLAKKVLEEQTRNMEHHQSYAELNEKIKYLEDIKPELGSQQRKLKDSLVQEIQKVSREVGLRVQVETKLKKVEERNMKLEDEVRQLKERLLAEECISKEVQTSSLKNLITSLHQVRSVINDNLDNITEYSPEVNQPDPVQRKQNNDNLEGRRNSRRTRERKSAIKPMRQRRQSREKMGTPIEKMQQEEFGYTTDSTTDYKSTSGYETASEFEWERALSPGSVEKMQQEEFGYTTDSTTNIECTSGYETASEFEWERALSPGSAAKIKLDEPGITTDPATDHEADARWHVFDDTSDTDTVKGDSDEEEVLDGQSKLEVCARVSVEGANLKIAETGVSLFIPPGALPEEQTIHMKIIPQPCDAKAALNFECNSVVVVELLPNNCRFQCPVSLTLPHCLQLKEEYDKNSVDVLISHHDEGFKPKWEILHDAKFNLWKENCTVSLHSFCWVTYEIHDTIVEAKRIKLYTAGKKMRLNDRITEVEVGFYPDLPGSGKILELNKDMHLSQRKPYVFLKTGEEPLLINLHKVVPKQWNNSQPDENPKIIPFDSVSISEERSCPFVLERSGDDTDIPLCIFKVGQKGRDEVELTIRPDVLTS